MLSAIVITRNEESNIKRCLSSLSFADETIVVDSGSTDKTKTIAQAMGARVFHHDWSGYGAQKNHGAKLASHDWLLFIDADEEVSPSLARKIKDSINKATSDFFWLRIVTIFLGQPLVHLYGHNLRLFRKQAGSWTQSHVHEQVATTSGQQLKLGDNLSQLLEPPLHHHSHQTISSYLKKMHHYTSLDAKHMLSTGLHRNSRKISPSFLLPLKLSLRQLIKLLFYRRGFLDGLPGIIWCFLSAYYEFEMSVKYLHLTLCQNK